MKFGTFCRVGFCGFRDLGPQMAREAGHGGTGFLSGLGTIFER